MLAISSIMLRLGETVAPIGGTRMIFVSIKLGEKERHGPVDLRQ